MHQAWLLSDNALSCEESLLEKAHSLHQTKLQKVVLAWEPEQQGETDVIITNNKKISYFQEM